MPQTTDDRVAKLNANLRELTRVLSALCKTNGGEMRVANELVDAPGDATQIHLLRDRKTNELIIRTAKENELPLKTFSVTPENIAPQTVNAPVPQQESAQAELPLERSTHTNVLDKKGLEKLESQLQARRVLRMIDDEKKAARNAQPQ
jgi:hypothetical protein